MSTIPVINQFIGAYSLLLTIFGTIGNLLSLFIFLKSKILRKYSTCKFLIALAIIDTLSLYWWNLQRFYKVYFGFTYNKLSVASCRISMFMAYSTLEISSWLLVLMSLDRFLNIKFACYRQRISFNPKMVRNLILTTISCFILINCHHLIFNGYADITVTNGTQVVTVVCYASRYSWYILWPVWEYFHLIIYVCVPFCFILLCNCLIIRQVYFTSFNNNRRRKFNMTLTLLTTTFCYIIMLLPSSLGFSVFGDVLSSNVLNLLDCILYTYHSIGFIIYTLTGQEFRSELKKELNGALHCLQLSFKNNTSIHPLVTTNR
ncbi:unnamed protein product [Didymodactylos carnosus]|uniref:G-protein coupled receptors family 1 profile domain-containing protein n=1 Tax=Didymodactylos carnosus TaxID=1234261 RepID=A0A8S2PNY7_9BILA|nr:unnamed protein product [Didymodactylos carnosus]CAF4064351.1 unnamed protein product [Didymodactylos carnosus]